MIELFALGGMRLVVSGFVGCCAWRVLYAVQLRSVGVVWLVLLVALLVVGLVVVWCFLLLM